VPGELVMVEWRGLFWGSWFCGVLGSVGGFHGGLWGPGVKLGFGVEQQEGRSELPGWSTTNDCDDWRRYNIEHCSNIQPSCVAEF